VIIFQKLRSLIDFKKITKPFNGKMVDEYAVEEEEFVKLSDPITFDKIVILDTVSAFDKFTSKYGILVKDKINIDWQNVNHDYDGFYIDKDNDFINLRNKKAFLKGEKFESWIKKYKIISGIVYLFD
jgi:hypothetical protein